MFLPQQLRFPLIYLLLLTTKTRTLRRQHLFLIFSFFWPFKFDIFLVPISLFIIVDGLWGNWSEFTECSKTCNGGNRERHRKCDNPQTKHGGVDCFSPDSIQDQGLKWQFDYIKECNTIPCKS